MQDRTDVWDIEIFPNCFTLSAVAVDNDKDILQFVLHESRNDMNALIDYLTSPGLQLIGYNNLHYDYPVVHPLVVSGQYWRNQPVQKIIRMLRERSDEILNTEDRKYIKPMIPQRDVMKIWHLDNKQRHASLKWIQCAIGWHNVQDMPFNYLHWIQDDEVNTVLEYNLNDILSTRAFYLHPKTQTKIDIRYQLSDRFGIPCHNWNDTKIGEQIIIHHIARSQGQDPRDLQNGRTYRYNGVKLADCILHNKIRLQSPQFTSILDRFKNMTVTSTRKLEDIDVVFDGMRYVFGLGGIHAARPQDIFYDVESQDVSSFYPNLAIQNGFGPAHLGAAFLQAYRDIYMIRKGYLKGTTENEGFKLALNGAFGKGNSEWSPLYDPKFLLDITINGQLLQAMLCEAITLSQAGTVIMANTDGIEVLVKNERIFRDILAEWQGNTGLVLEGSMYSKIAIRDVNNYIAVKTNGEVKAKGDYLIDRDFHSDHSMKVTAMAAQAYLTAGTSVRDFVHTHRQIGDFLIMKRAKTGNILSRQLIDNKVVDTPLPPTMRYYISKEGVVLMKMTDKKSERVHDRGLATLFNRWEDKPFDQFNLDLNFYVRKANALVTGTSAKKKGQLVSGGFNIKQIQPELFK